MVLLLITRGANTEVAIVQQLLDYSRMSVELMSERSVHDRLQFEPILVEKG